MEAYQRTYDHINSVATALLRVHPEWGISRIIATAVNWAKKVCATGRAFGGRVKVSAAVKAAACKAVEEWNRKKMAASEEWIDSKIMELTEYDYLGLALAKKRVELRDNKKEIPSKYNLTDEEYCKFEFEMTDEEWSEVESTVEGVSDLGLDTEHFLNLVEEERYANAMVRFPVLSMSEPSHLTGNTYRKEIARTGTIKIGNKVFELTSDFLKKLKENYEKNIGELSYVPLQFVDKDNKHSDDPRLYGGEIKELTLDNPDKPTKLFANFEVVEDAKKAIQATKNRVGASIKAYRDYYGQGPLLVHVAMTPREKLKGMAAWEPVLASEEHDTIDLSDAEFKTIDLTTGTIENDEGGKDMADNKTATVEPGASFELTDEVIKQILDSDTGKSIITASVTEAVQQKDQEIENLRNSVVGIQSKSYKQAVEASVDSYANKGVPKVLRDAAKALMLSFADDGDNDTLEFTEGEGDNAETKTVSRVQLVTRMLDEAKGFVDLGAEEGSEEDDTDNVLGLTSDQRQNAVSFLAGKTRENNS